MKARPKTTRVQPPGMEEMTALLRQFPADGELVSATRQMALVGCLDEGLVEELYGHSDFVYRLTEKGRRVLQTGESGEQTGESLKVRTPDSDKQAETTKDTKTTNVSP
jgi:hypothetical protein